jgi:uncharacterized protein YecT (DUF1311 family)
MRIVLVVVSSLLLISSICRAQESPEWRSCDQKAKSQAEVYACAADEAKRDDVELNRVYRQLLQKNEKNAAVVSKIKTFERSWISYRDSYIAAMYPAENKAAYGSSYPTLVCLLGAKLTRQQTAALQDLMKELEKDVD